jgi:hypothetical protein
VDAWTFIWLMVILKIPIVGLFLIIRWALRDAPETTIDENGGVGPRAHPHHPRPRLPRTPRRGPHHGSGAPLTPMRTRKVLARGRIAAH